MTRYERDIMTDNNIAPDLMEQIGKYLKQKRRASTLPRKKDGGDVERITR